MQAVEHWKLVIASYTSGNELAVYVWRAPGSKTINARIKWGDGTWSNVITDPYAHILQPLIDWAIIKFAQRPINPAIDDEGFVRYSFKSYQCIN
jgi:hypothetical protein